MTLFAVDGHLLWQVVWVSLLAGVGISALFSFVLVGAVRANEARRAGRAGAASAYGVLAVLWRSRWANTKAVNATPAAATRTGPIAPSPNSVVMP